jgi:hypothetical protein
MKGLLLNLFSFLLCFHLTAQDSLRSRIIFIGDAGEMDKEQKQVLEDAAARIVPGKTLVMYLGDNIYPAGMGLPGSPEEEETKKIMRSQYMPMRANNAPVYFIPGNHDWDRMNEQGLAKIKAQGNFLKEQKDSLLKMVPANGCPDPYEIRVNDRLVIIAFDSEWWVFTKNKDNPDGGCSCKTEEQVLAQMKTLYEKNKDKIIFLASHHPFTSYGVHGGHYTWKDHLFPLTALNYYYLLPLPVIGSLYPFLRTTFFKNPEDLNHPLYKKMVKKIDNVFSGYNNMIHVSGHEHGLQFIKAPKHIQVVSGAGVKHTEVKKGKYSQFAISTQGYVVADQLKDNSIRFSYYTLIQDSMQVSFTYLKKFDAQ